MNSLRGGYMENQKINFSLRMTKEVSEYIASEASRVGMSKNSFMLFLVEMYRRENEDANMIKISNLQMYEAVKKQIENEGKA